MSELILDGAAHHVDLAPFAPGRLPPLDQGVRDDGRTSDLKAASEQVSASGQRNCLKVLSALVAAVRHPAAASAL
jgi:hypothetical protein